MSEARTRRMARAAMLVALVVGSGSCRSQPPAAAPVAELPPLHLSPATDLAAAAGLVWMVDLHPRAFFARPEMVIAMRQLMADTRFEAFARRHGGVDLRRLEDFVIAEYPETTLFIARGVVDPTRVEAAFAQRATVEGRGIDRKGGALGSIVRTWGSVLGTRQQLAVLGHEAVVVEAGRFGPLRAATYFAQEKLRKASPALRAAPLDQAARVAGEAPIRAFAPGPFTGEWTKAAAGLLAACTAIAVTVTPAAGPEEGGRLAIRVVLLGDWREGGTAVTARLSATANALAESALGRLAGLNEPIRGPDVRATDDALILDVTVAALPVFRGLAAATGAGADAIMRY